MPDSSPIVFDKCRRPKPVGRRQSRLRLARLALVLGIGLGLVAPLLSPAITPIAEQRVASAAPKGTQVFLPGVQRGLTALIVTLAVQAFSPTLLPPLGGEAAPAVAAGSRVFVPSVDAKGARQSEPSQPVPTATPVPEVPTPVPSIRAPGRTEYFVSVAGSDSHDGRSPATAWRTFANVRAGKVASGSTILAEAGGVWSETVTVPKDDLWFGVHGSGPRPKIVAPDGAYAFHANWKSGVRLEGWELTSATRKGARWGIVHVSQGDYVIRNIVVHGADGWMFMVRGPRGLVENSEFYDNDGNFETVAVSVGGYEGSGYPPTSDVTVFRNNVVRDTGYRAVANWGSNVLIEGNRVERWSRPGRGGSATEAPAGIYVASRFLGDVVVRNNTLVGTGTEHWGLWVDTAPEHRTRLYGNTVRNARRCMWAEKTSNVVFQGNTCEQVHEAGVRWGSGIEDPVQIPSLNGQVVGNVFVGPEPTQGWVRIFQRSSATVEDNTYRS